MTTAKKSLIFNINILIVLVVTLMTGIFGSYGYKRAKESVDTILDLSLQQVCERLKKSLEIPLWNVDYNVLEMVVSTEMQDENIAGIVVNDSFSGEIILSKTRNSDWECVGGEVEVDRNLKSRETTVTLQGKELGKIKVFYTDRFVQSAFDSRIKSAALLMVFFLAITVVVLSVALSRIIINPLRDLTKVSKVVAGGEYNLAITTSRNDEIGVLSNSFDNVRLAVRDKIDSLNSEIEERKKVEQQLRSLRNLLNSIIASMPSILIAVDGDCVVTQWNDEVVNATGIDRDKAVGARLKDLSSQLPELCQNVLRSITDKNVKKETKVDLVIHGEDKFVDITIYPLSDDVVGGAVIRIDDVTERVRLEEMMIQTEKMISVGGLAAGMAHEINNPLAGIMQNVQVIQNRLSPEMNKNREVAERCGVEMDNIAGYLEERGIKTMFEAVVQSGKQAASIVNNMLTFSRKSGSGFLAVDIVDLMEKAVELSCNNYDLKNKFDFRQISLVREFEVDIPTIKCDGTMIQQVFLNLLKNGAQALFDDSILYKWDKTDDSPTLILRVYKKNSNVIIEVEDNGIGFDEQVSKRIFEPFYTTKNVGMGTGLGLSVSYFIVAENHNGQLEVASTPNVGTVFKVSLPIS